MLAPGKGHLCFLLYCVPFKSKVFVLRFFSSFFLITSLPVHLPTNAETTVEWKQHSPSSWFCLKRESLGLLTTTFTTVVCVRFWRRTGSAHASSSPKNTAHAEAELLQPPYVQRAAAGEGLPSCPSIRNNPIKRKETPAGNGLHMK